MNATGEQHDADCALRMEGVTKTFPGVRALDGASLSVGRGEVHGLVGENGAGKSTIIKILAGVYHADAGSVSVDGEPLERIDPASVHRLGVRFIHQEISLVPHFSVAESVFLGQEQTGRLGTAKRAMRERAETFLAETLGVELDGRALVRDLSVAERKLVQIARALIDGRAKLVVFDEPTAVLAAAEVKTLFTAIDTLRRAGKSMLYVSHYLNEIHQICDRVTVFRNGADVGVVDLRQPQQPQVRVPEIIRLMVGRDIGDLYPQRRRSERTRDALEVAGLDDGHRLRGVSLTVGAGEVVGLTGIIGSGRAELVDSLYGLRKIRAGKITVDGEPARTNSPARAVRSGLALVPRDRRNDGLVLDMTVADNVNLATLEEVSTLGWLNRAAAGRRGEELMERLDVRPRGSHAVSRLLSGGNQQKVVLGRWLASQASVYVLDDPTVGVDVGARSEIYRLIADLAQAGAGVLMCSNDPAELLGMCDRILVMVRGRIIADIAAADTDHEHLTALATGGAEAA
ncbi:MAG: sugar ABC transporter ATP-binding protein [Acidimicrobiaceae bacterium]|nr:sugar ABC transporter ATP-binding protein [Acidimicrobiaceae bacterium]MCY4281155.1 sugar ABC transporter ATP-binding protein [Acidimicrobiaceae bacterium]MCY4294380.1 sugar ABC transporter ATP-binding protein [Acidimicrobiaceae bacterium]